MSKSTIIRDAIAIGHFKSKDEAIEFYKSVKNFAILYGVATVADAIDLCGDDSTWDDNLMGWSLNVLHRAMVERVVSDHGWEYTVRFPECDWNNTPNNSHTVDEQNVKDQSNPICVTIYSKECTSYEDAFRVLFDNINKVKDRSVFLTIM